MDLCFVDFKSIFEYFYDVRVVISYTQLLDEDLTSGLGDYFKNKI
jgi:hypothetical protein